MTTTELKRFRDVLAPMQAELQNVIRNREALAIEMSPDELDRIQHATERELAIDNIQRDFSRLREVQAALRRIDTGAFGVCVDCGEDIVRKRLAAVPWTRSCIACQEAADRECGHSIGKSLVYVAA